MGNIQTLTPTFSLISKPQNYPADPTPGKIELLWGTNEQSLYHRLSPYTQYSDSLIPGFTNQPFLYDYPDEGNKGLSGLRKYESRMFPIGSAPRDVIRVAKFLGSGNGIIFLGKQFLLQTGNAFNETRIYNPTSPIVAAGMGLALGSIRPRRSFDTSGGLLGIASALIGDAIPNALFGAPKVNKPSSTAPDALTGGPLENTGGKGLIRGGTANTARSHLEAAWPQAGKGGGMTKSFLSVVGGIVKSLFSNFLPATQKGISQRSDEGAYGLMIGAGKPKFSDENTYSFNQRWFGGGTIIRKNGQDNADNAGMLYPQPDGRNILITDRNLVNIMLNTEGSVSVGYDIKVSNFRDGIRYGESFGANVNTEYKASDIMKAFAYYIDFDKKYPTKKTEKNDIDSLNQSLTDVLNDIKKASDKLYFVSVPDDATVIRSGKSKSNGYDRITKTNQKGLPKTGLNYPLGVLQDYRTVTVVDETLNQRNKQRSYKLPAAGKFDSINTLTVFSKKERDTDTEWNKLELVGWGKPWEPYKDDLIAFYFYDIVNENFIPFRASVKGIVESGNASWEEMPFIGRGDKLYTYGGFNRNLTLSFKIVISSIAELAPTWQRINYLTTLIKPANYTTSDAKLNGIDVTNRFMVPPMVLLTLGDMYKEQPVLIQTVSTTIPEDATWETINEEGSVNSMWNYLSNYIKAPDALYGQLPREVEINLTLLLLEKERAIVGGINFGNNDNNFQKSLIVTVDKSLLNPPSLIP